MLHRKSRKRCSIFFPTFFTILLSCDTFWQKMIAILQDMTKSYETGECTNGE